MPHKIEISAIKYQLDELARKYVEKKANRLFKYLPSHAKKSANLKVTIEELSKKRDDKFQVDLLFRVPDKVLVATGNGTSVLAAVDIAEAKMLSQIRRYKTEITPQLGSRSGWLRQAKERFFRHGR